MVAEAEETYELSSVRPGYAEIDPHDWSRALDRCVGRLCTTPVAAVGFSGQMHGVVLTGCDGTTAAAGACCGRTGGRPR